MHLLKYMVFIAVYGIIISIYSLGYAGPTAIIKLDAYPNFIFWNGKGNSSVLISAQLFGQDGQPVETGTPAVFRSSDGTYFPNGSSELFTATTNDRGLITTALVAMIDISGIAYVTCESNNVIETIGIPIVSMEYETEPNDSSTQADQIIFNHPYYAQLASPYDQDWYKFSIDSISQVSINFITTAIPEGAGCEGTTTIGTYRIDVRNSSGQTLASYQNVDCNYNNGIWHVGFNNPGTYFIVVFCPRQPDTSHYLSSPYYLTTLLGY